MTPKMAHPQTWDPERYARNARFVADLGAPVVDLLAPRAGERILALGCRDGEAASPWYFPTVADYSQHLTSGGFVVNYIALIPRPTPLPDDVTGFLETFAESFTTTLPSAERPSYID